jgi:hypothetical protein
MRSFFAMLCVLLLGAEGCKESCVTGSNCDAYHCYMMTGTTTLSVPASDDGGIAFDAGLPDCMTVCNQRSHELCSQCGPGVPGTNSCSMTTTANGERHVQCTWEANICA